MIPILYDSDEKVFRSNGLCRLRDCTACTVTEERNGIYELDFEYPIDAPNFDKIRAGRIIACTHDDSGDVQPFDIVSHSKPINGVVTFHAVHISYRLNGGTTYAKNVKTLAAAMNELAQTPQDLQTDNFTFKADFTGSAYVAAFDGVPHTIREYLGGLEGSILDTFGGEYEFDKFNVILHRNRGTKKDFAIRYGVNMVDYTDESDYSEVFNQALPYWIGQSSKGGETIQIGNIAWLNTTKLYHGRSARIPLDLSDKFESKPTAEELRQEALAYIKANNTYQPQRTITVDFIRLQEFEDYQQFTNLLTCKLCDSIRVIFPLYGEDAYYKIVKTEYNVLLDRFNEMELGDLSTSLSDFIGSGSGTFQEGDVLGGLYKITEMSVSVPAINAHSYKAGTSYSIPTAARVEGYNLAGIVGYSTGNYRIIPHTHYIEGNTNIYAGFSNTSASNVTATVNVTFRLLWLKGTAA